jgi:hypothetical protein
MNIILSKQTAKDLKHCIHMICYNCLDHSADILHFDDEKVKKFGFTKPRLIKLMDLEDKITIKLINNG